MILVIGLGNPEEKYAKTRHNLGFMVVDKLARKILPLTKSHWKKDFRANALILSVSPALVLTKPQSFMNASGYAVAKLTSRYALDASSLWVIHDDVDLPLGKLKIRIGGGAAGHHGVESIIRELGTDKFLRFRLGIGHPGRGSDALVERYVLREFDVNERSEIHQLIKKAVKAIQVALKEGFKKAMNEYN